MLTVVDHPLIASLLTQLRDKNTSPPDFRRNLGTIGTLLVYEATRDLIVAARDVETPMAAARGVELAEQVGLFPILRAGLGFVEGALSLYPNAHVWHLGMYRDEITLEPVGYYNKINGQLTEIDYGIVLDPMLATGGSAIAAISILKDAGVHNISMVSLLATTMGLGKVKQIHPTVRIVVAAVDEQLNDIGFIVPGLGDAGDRQYGTGK